MANVTHAGLLGKGVVSTPNVWTQLLAIPTTLSQNSVDYTVAYAVITVNVSNGTANQATFDLAISSQTNTANFNESDCPLNQFKLDPNGVFGYSCVAVSPGEIVAVRSNGPILGVQVRGMYQLRTVV